MNANPWKTLDSEIVYRNPHIAFRKDSVSTPAGSPGEYGVVERPGGVFIVAMTADHSICLIRQFRYPVQLSTWEVPAGGIDGSEDKLVAAQRELAEEAGLKADDWELLGVFFPAPGYSSESSHVFLAQGLHDIDYKESNPDERIENKKFCSLKDIAGLMQSDTPFDGPTITAISMACVKLGLKIG
jgi:ADP-ribose pyrophosphatase